MIDALPLLLSDEGYQISRSVRLRSSASAYFNRTPGSAGNRKTWTWSGWVKRGTLGTVQIFTSCHSATTDASNMDIGFYADDTLRVVAWTTTYRTTTQVFRDPSAWYHLMIVIDTTQATANDRVKLYVNGTQVTVFTTTNNPTQNSDIGYNQAATTRIGSSSNAVANLFDGYLTEINFIDGQALTPSSFGETNAVTGVWQPKKYAGTYGTNGFYLNFSDNSAATAAAIGKDYSGNGNNWTPNNISVTAGVTYDSMLDVPTQWADGGNGRGNYCTLNPIHYNNATITEANLKHTSAGAGSVGRGTVAVSSGKWYYEFTLTSLGSVGSFLGGIIDSQQPNNTPTNLATVTGAMWLYRDDGYTANAGGSVNTGVTYTNNDVISVAFDVDGQKIWWAKNGTWLSSGDPAAGTNAQYTNVSSTANSFMPFVNEQAATSAGVFNFGQRPFAYTPPSGFKALNTLNLPTPTILKGNQYFDVVLYTGNAVQDRAVTGFGFDLDLAWIKSRNNAGSHVLVNREVGGDKQLFSNLTNAEQTNSDVTNGFTTGGILVGDNLTGTGSTNQNTYTYALWGWKEGATQGFDIVTYTGNGGTQNISHNLGVAPRMMIIKSRSVAQRWTVYHASVSNAYIYLNETFAADTANAALRFGNNSAVVQPTSSVFTIGNSVDVNQNTTTYVAYLFAAVAGYSAFGSYTGNGSADGTFVFTGFRPAFVLVKKTSGVDNWEMFDDQRPTYNPASLGLSPNSSALESTSRGGDFLSNGFKLRFANGTSNESGYTYIYAAFAEHPFKNALAR